MSPRRVLTVSFYQVFCLLGDGKSTGGSVWETLACTSCYNLNNLITIFDMNRIGHSDSMSVEHCIATRSVGKPLGNCSFVAVPSFCPFLLLHCNLTSLMTGGLMWWMAMTWRPYVMCSPRQLKWEASPGLWLLRSSRPEACQVFPSCEYSNHLFMEQSRQKEAVTRLMISLVNSVTGSNIQGCISHLTSLVNMSG